MNNAVESRPARSLVGRILALTVAAAMVLLGVVIPAQAASAATVVTTPQEVHDAFQAGGDVVLGEDITVDDQAGAAAVAVPTEMAVVLDLNGFQLTSLTATSAAAIEVPGGAAFTVVDSVGGGRLEATATGFGAAGVGGSDHGSTGEIAIAGGTVIARGGETGAGIGSGQLGGTGSVTISGGDVTATGGAAAAGIGGGGQASAISVIITGGSVTAFGGDQGPGIGNGFMSSGGSVEIYGGTVAARGATYGAGIGGGSNAGGLAVTIEGGDVLAEAGGEAAAIGGGTNGNGGTVVIGENATVTASTPGETSASAIGGGRDGAFGSLVNNGELIIPAPSRLTIPAGTAVQNSGVITGDGTIDGAGVLVNSGVTHHMVNVDHTSGLIVTGKHYALAFEPNGGSVEPAGMTVYAPTLDSAGMSLSDLPVPTRSGGTFTGWFLDSALTMPLTNVLEFNAVPSGGIPVPVPVYAGWQLLNPTVTVDPETISLVGFLESGVTVSASGFPENAQVDVARNGEFIETLTSDATGGISYVLKSSGLYPRVHTVTMTSGEWTASDTFRIVEPDTSITVDREVLTQSEFAETGLSVSGQGFYPLGLANLSVGGEWIASMGSDAAGDIAAYTVIQDEYEPGTYILRLSDGVFSAETTFEIVADPPVYHPNVSVEPETITLPEFVDAGASVAGSGFPAESAVDLALDGEAVVTLTSDADGAVSYAIEQWGLALGEHTVTMTSGEWTASGVFTILPVGPTALALDPDSLTQTALAESGTVLTGENFYPGATAQVTVDGAAAGSADVASDGSLSAPLVLADYEPGTYTVNVSDGFTSAATATLTVTADATPTPTPTPSATPTVTPTPGPTPTVTPTPTAVPSPQPTSTPSPTAEPSPKPTSSPSPEPAPTSPPSPEPVPPSPSPEPEPAAPSPEPSPSTDPTPSPSEEPVPAPSPAQPAGEPDPTPTPDPTAAPATAPGASPEPTPAADPRSLAPTGGESGATPWLAAFLLIGAGALVIIRRRRGAA